MSKPLFRILTMLLLTLTRATSLNTLEDQRRPNKLTKEPGKSAIADSNQYEQERPKTRLPVSPSAPITPNSQLSGAVDADFFVTGIVPDFTTVCYAFGPCFLSPFVHLVLILKEPVTAKNVAACKRGRRDFY